MTFEELKAEADRQGYKLIKKSQYIKLERCPRCGKYPQQWCGKSGIFYSCHQYKSEPCQSERTAKLAWNRMVSYEQEKNGGE